jgi:hypothetical protein
MEEDTSLLREANIMDYSLYLAIEKGPDFVTKKSTIGRNTDFISEDAPSEMIKSFTLPPYKYLSFGGQYIYHIAIIDYLQDYNFDKKVENFYKTIKNRKDAQISAIPPLEYRTRYLKYMAKEVFISQSNH